MNVVNVGDGRFAFMLDWVVTRESEESTSGLFIDRLRDVTFQTLVQVENFLLGAACGVTILITMTVVDRFLQDACVPSVNVVCMISVTGGVAIRKHKWLSRIQGLRPIAIKNI